jgi:hypothetical protein
MGNVWKSTCSELYWREWGRHLVMIRPASHAKLTSGVGGKAVEIGEMVRLR